MFIPEISASKVAGLIGKNPYKNSYEIVYELLCKDKHIKNQISDIEKATNRRPFNSVVNDLLRESSVRSCVVSGLREAQHTQDVTGVLERVETQAKDIVNRPEFAPDVQTRLATEIRGQVSKQRGLRNESSILNSYETQQNVRVTERNTKTLRKDYGKFRLIGRIDGYVESENRIVDSKDRTRKWTSVPEYDEIQLRCYMDMTGATESELVERFPDGSVRTTKFLNDPERWQEIRIAIEAAADEMNAALKDTESLKQIIDKNTIILNGGHHPTKPAGRVSIQTRLNL